MELEIKKDLGSSGLMLTPMKDTSMHMHWVKQRPPNSVENDTTVHTYSQFNNIVEFKFLHVLKCNHHRPFCYIVIVTVWSKPLKPYRLVETETIKPFEGTTKKFYFKI